MRKKQKIFETVLILMLSLSDYLPIFAVSGSAQKILRAEGQLANAVITVFYGIFVLATALSIVKSGLGAQINAHIGKSMRMSNEVLKVVETLAIFIVGMFALPIVKGFINGIIAKIGGGSAILGDNLFH